MKDNRENNFLKNDKDFLGKKRDPTQDQNDRNPRNHGIKNDHSRNFNEYGSSNSNKDSNNNFTNNFNAKSGSPPIKRLKGNGGNSRQNQDEIKIEDHSGNKYNNEAAFNSNQNNKFDRNISNNYRNFSKNTSNSHSSYNNINNNNTRNNYNNTNFNSNLRDQSYSNSNKYYQNNTNNFSNFSQDKKKDHDSIRISYYGLENLPIMNHKQEILDLLATEQVIIISGTTGCGKTTQVPKFIYEKLKQDFPNIFQLNHNGEKNDYRKILITQPRRIAAVSIAKRLCQELKCNLGQEVGYHVGLNPNYNRDTRIVICTTGIFLQKIINNDSIKDYAYIVIDEVHERDADIDLLLVMLKHLISKNPNVKLILMSATISIKLFSGYFGRKAVKNVSENDLYNELKIDKTVKIEERKDLWNNPMELDKEHQKKLMDLIDLKANEPDAAKVVEIKMKIFDVKIFYIETIEHKLKQKYSHIPKLLSYLNYIPGNVKSNPLIDKCLYGVAFLIILEIIEGFLGEDENNSILVFLPGINEIQELEKTIRSNLEMHKPELLSMIKICQLHSAISDEEQQQIFTITEERKIIISTNIAESSITIPDTKYVIDFCLVKELKHSTYNDTESLELTWSSRASCDQRKGRAGRVSDGFCFRLVRQAFYENEMDSCSRAEILRIPLEKTILRLKVWNGGEPADILGRCIEPPNIKLVNMAIHTLQNYGALTLDSIKSPTGELTQLGIIYSILPLEIKYSRLIILAYAFNLIEPAIIIASILSQEKSIFRNHNPIDAYDQKDHYSKGTECDFIATYYAYVKWFSNFYREYKFDAKNRIPNNEMQEEREYAEKLKLNYYVLKEVKVLSFDILKRMHKLNYLKSKELGFDSKKMSLKSDDEIFYMKIVFSGAFYGKIMKATYANFEVLKKRMKDKDKYLIKDCFTVGSINHSIVNEESKKVKLEDSLFLKNWDSDKNHNQELSSLIKSIVGFDAMMEVTYKYSEYLINFKENKSDVNKRLIKKLLNLSSPMRSKDSIFALTQTSHASGNRTFTNQIKLPRPEYVYEIRLNDIFHSRAVECDVNSLNHIIIESDKKSLNTAFYVSDNFYSRNNKYVCRYSCKLPEIHMIDKLLILIFTPTAKFWPFNLNDPNENERYGYSHFKSFGCAGEFSFNYSFCSQDVQILNLIRKKINKLVLGLNNNDDFESESNLLRQYTKKLLTKKRFKVITNPDFWRIFCHYYQDEFEKIKSGLRLFRNEELGFQRDQCSDKTYKDDFSLSNYANGKHPQEYFEKNNFSDFYSQKLRMEFKDRNEEEDLKKTSGKDSDNDSDCDDQFAFGGNKRNKKAKKDKDNEVNKSESIKVEVKEENMQQKLDNNDNKSNDRMGVEAEEEVNSNKFNSNNNTLIDINNMHNLEAVNKLNSEIKEETDLQSQSRALNLKQGKETKNEFDRTELNYLENLATTFLPELERLQFKEDQRLFNASGEADLAAERHKFSEMRKRLFKDFEDFRRLCAQDSVMIECSLCHSFICNVSNLKPYDKKLHKITGWLDPFIKEVELNEVNFENSFIIGVKQMLERLSNKDTKIAKFISCPDGDHIFGFKNHSGESFISHESQVRIVFPCGEIENFNEFWAQDNYEQIFIKNAISILKREKLIKEKAECLLCKVNLGKNLCVKEIDSKRKEHFEKNKFHMEMVKELVEEDFE